ncbi:MAG: hypothetical protein GY765_43985, partial [bacterium]|nr:hypothetical protein [bacterium]
MTEKREHYPLSPAQKRLYILQQIDAGSTVYNIPNALVLEGDLDTTHLETVFQKLTLRHESLRTAFIEVNGEPRQKILPEGAVRFKVEIPTRQLNPEAGFLRSFDLSTAPLLRVRLVKKEKQRHIMMLDVHHIAADGVSVSVLTEEFMTLYSGSDPALPELTYKDYAQWITGKTGRALLKQQE